MFTNSFSTDSSSPAKSRSYRISGIVDIGSTARVKKSKTDKTKFLKEVVSEDVLHLYISKDIPKNHQWWSFLLVLLKVKVLVLPKATSTSDLLQQ